MAKKTDKEIWKRLPKPYADYAISDQGRIKSYKKNAERLLNPYPDNKGYLSVNLWDSVENRRRSWAMHRLVLFAFIGKSKLHVSHKNHIKTDNRLKNLEYATQKENNRQGFKDGRYKLKGKHQTKLKPKQVLEIYHSNDGYRVLAERFGVNKCTVWNIKRQKTWKHLTQEIAP